MGAIKDWGLTEGFKGEFLSVILSDRVIILACEWGIKALLMDVSLTVGVALKDYIAAIRLSCWKIGQLFT